MKTCNDCKNYRETTEYHPYGSTYAAETLSECLYDDPPDEWPLDAEKCPGFDPIDILDDPLWVYYWDDPILSKTMDDILANKKLKKREEEK